MKIKKRKDSDFSGYYDSDRDFFEDNRELILSILEPNVENKIKALETIDFHCQQIDIISYKLIESEARKILSKHPNLNEFVMAMGSAFFLDKQNRVVQLSDKTYLKPFDELVCRLNEICKVCASPMRCTATGKRITNW
jgi:hypothetical protein